MDMRHAIILLDIDNTLINFSASSPTYNLVTDKDEINIAWTGGTQKIWLDNIEVLKKAALEQNIYLHFGVSTYKPVYMSDEYKAKGFKGDYLSAAVVENENYIKSNEFQIVQGLGVNLGLKKTIHPDLIYYTNGQSKVFHSLRPAIALIEKNYSVHIDPKDAYLIDDQTPTCNDVIMQGHSACCVTNLHELSITEQKARIFNLFETLFLKFNIPFPLQANTSSITSENSIYAAAAALTFFYNSIQRSSISNTSTLESNVMDNKELNNEPKSTAEESYKMERDPISHKLFVIPLDDETKEEKSNLLSYHP